MGEARRRGTFEERKAQAIAAGRIKGQGQGYILPDALPFRPFSSVAGSGALPVPARRQVVTQARRGKPAVGAWLAMLGIMAGIHR